MKFHKCVVFFLKNKEFTGFLQFARVWFCWVEGEL